jgi:hypothetical protein
VPEYVTEADITQKNPDILVKGDVWPAGAYAEILHLGPYCNEAPTVEKLHNFIEQQGYKIAGHHEEEYLTMPNVKNQKTLIRYLVNRKFK